MGRPCFHWWEKAMLVGVSQTYSPVEDAFLASQELRSCSGVAVGGGGRGLRYPARLLRPGSRTVWVAMCLALAPSTSILALVSEAGSWARRWAPAPFCSARMGALQPPPRSHTLCETK